MPFTVSHVAAVLPLRFVWKKTSLRAAALGAMMPDVGYFLACPQDFNVLSHGMWSSLAIGIPLTLLFLSLLLTFEVPFYWLLRLQVPNRQYSISFASFFAMLASMIAGIWSHVFLDGFTHKYSWAVMSSPLLQSNVGFLPLYKWLQYGSSVLGLAAVLWVYARQEKSTPESKRARIWKIVLGFSAVLFALNALLFPPQLALRPMVGEYIVIAMRALGISVGLACFFLNWERPNFLRAKEKFKE